MTPEKPADPKAPPTDFERFVSAIARVPKDEADAVEPTDESPSEESGTKEREQEG